MNEKRTPVEEGGETLLLAKDPNKTASTRLRRAVIGGKRSRAEDFTSPGKQVNHKAMKNSPLHKKFLGKRGVPRERRDAPILEGGYAGREEGRGAVVGAGRAKIKK